MHLDFYFKFAFFKVFIWLDFSQPAMQYTFEMSYNLWSSFVRESAFHFLLNLLVHRSRYFELNSECHNLLFFYYRVESQTFYFLRPKRNIKLFLKGLLIYLRFEHALWFFLCSYTLNFSSGEEATEGKMRIIFLVCQDISNWVVLEGKTCAST